MKKPRNERKDEKGRGCDAENLVTNLIKLHDTSPSPLSAKDGAPCLAKNGTNFIFAPAWNMMDMGSATDKDFRAEDPGVPRELAKASPSSEADESDAGGCGTENGAVTAAVAAAVAASVQTVPEGAEPGSCQTPA